MVITVRRVWLREVLRFMESQTGGEAKEAPLVAALLAPFGNTGLLAPFTTETERVIGFAQAKEVSTSTGEGDRDSRQESSEGCRLL